MKVAFLRVLVPAAIVAVALVDLACGAKSPADPSASPSPVAQATPTPPPPPPPTPAPTPDPQGGLAAGPVASVKVTIHTVEISHGSQQFRDAQKDSSGRFVLYVGEWVVLDSTQRNAAGLICRWRHNPEYFWDNDDGMMDIRQSTEPFFFKFLVAKAGIAQVTSRIDGIESNDILFKAVPRPK